MKIAQMAFLTMILSNASFSQPVNMSFLNSDNLDAEPTFSADGRTVYFNCHAREGRSGSDICVTHFVESTWSEPIVVKEVSSDNYSDFEPLLSPDGSQLFIMSDRPGGKGSMDLWVSNRADNGWSTPVNLEGPFNTPYMDHCIYFTGENWEIAYWTSTRPGGYGANDIWSSKKVNGVWQDAVNLGPNVNSEFDEHHSLPSEDGRSLYITATLEEGFGGEDIYVSHLASDGTWTELVNLGPEINTETSDRCPAFSPDFSLFYFDSERSGGQGSKDIWRVPYDSIRQIR
jgi:Tol biopolymer transport system component